MDVEPTATAGADHQTGEVRRSSAHSSHGICTCAVGREPRLVALILLGRNVGRAVIGEQDQPLIWRHHHPTRAWSLRLLATGIVLSSSVDVGTSVEGVFEHHL
jgi:hypothetical protein